jgi:glycerate kinase
VRGADFVFDAVGVDAALEGADLVLTGEGQLDAQSVRGKVVGALARRAHSRGVPTVALVGVMGPGANGALDEGLSAIFSICDGPMTEEYSVANAAPLLERTAEHVARVWKAKFRG